MGLSDDALRTEDDIRGGVRGKSLRRAGASRVTVVGTAPIRVEVTAATAARGAHPEEATVRIGAETPMPRWCHASCCSGETEITGPYGAHDAQLYLDEKGYPTGWFGDEHETVLFILVLARRDWKKETWP